MSDQTDTIAKVRRALGRTEPLKSAPTPPAIIEPITRLVHSDIGLPELFAMKAAENLMRVERIDASELSGKLAEFLKSQNCRRLALPVSPLLQKLQVSEGLKKAGFDVSLWNEISLDQLYDFDCGVTDVYCAVAETGSLVIRASEGHGRALSLVPKVHVAVLEPKNFVADLMDAIEKIGRDGLASATTFISGPSKTADIEMNMVTGVHGPAVVQIFILA